MGKASPNFDVVVVVLLERALLMPRISSFAPSFRATSTYSAAEGPRRRTHWLHGSFLQDLVLVSYNIESLIVCLGN
jgi:hypothetical protein